MSRRVQFSSANVSYSPNPATPSPSASLSSLPSTPDIPTPPPELHAATPILYQGTPYPHDLEFQDAIEPKDMEEMEVHCCLAYPEPEITHHLSVKFDPDEHQYLPLDDPATNPPLQCIVIVSDLFLEHWAITVRASYTPFVTVSDVLTAMYKQLRKPVTQAQYDSLSKANKAEVDRAFQTRLTALPTDEEVRQEVGKGIKRIDFLKKQRQFMGLSLTNRGPNVWELNVS